MHPDQFHDAWIWLGQTTEDLAAARQLAENPDMPARLAAFLANLAAEKALKAALIARGIPIRKIHDLVALQAALPKSDAEVVSSDDIDVLVPWNIAGRYPADIPDGEAHVAMSTVDAAARIVSGLSRLLADR